MPIIDGIACEELALAHASDTCDGIMIPQTFYQTSKKGLRVVGYCSKCKMSLWHDYLLSHLWRTCPPPPAPAEATELALPKEVKLITDGRDAKFLRTCSIVPPEEEENLGR